MKKPLIPDQFEDIQFLGKKNNDDRFDFSSIPILDSKAVEIIGYQGGDFIHERIQEMILWKRYIYGKNDLNKIGLSLIQEFAHKTSCSILWVFDQSIADFQEQFPESDVQFSPKEKKLAENNYALLKETKHYLIYVKYALSNNDFNDYIKHNSGL